ncbi:TIGR02677 family protein [Peribacillus sp. SCS-26]|uniref:TIGR02677 family protein n=1 Tax=Paraperibacillus marinus TaxID=3115295 RepID=UPI003906217C
MYDGSMKKVTEASYLTVDKAWSYRFILRYFFNQHERMRDFIHPEEIYEHIKNIPEFYGYTEEQIHLDLAQLVKWNNLIARQDMGKAKTIEEYKKKRFRYQCTPYTVEIERMLQKLEGIGETFQGSLERTQFDRLLQTLVQLETMISSIHKEKTEEVAQLWEDLFSYFTNIRRNTADYIAYINSEKVEERMQSEAFLLYKNQFTVYLRDFIVSLQKTAMQIQERLKGLTPQNMLVLYQKIIEYKNTVPRLEVVGLSHEELIMEQSALWETLCLWFLGSGNRQSELEVLQIQTNEMIRRITRVVQRIGERHQNFRSRKRDYHQLAKWFMQTQDVKEAHQLSSVVFGTLETHHITGEGAQTENIYADIWDEPPAEITIKPRTNRYREKTKPGAIIATRKEKEAMRKQYLEKMVEEKRQVEKYMTDRRIQISQLPVVEPHVRKLLLTWIGKSMTSTNQTVKTEYGMTCTVILHKETRVTLSAQDGQLEMPDAELIFSEE